MWYAGMDVHLKSSSVCVLDEHGYRVVQKRIRGPWPKLLEWLKGLEEPSAVCYEASCGYGPLHDALRRLAHQIQVAHPGHLRLIFRSKKKNDRLPDVVSERSSAAVLFALADSEFWRATNVKATALAESDEKSIEEDLGLAFFITFDVGCTPVDEFSQPVCAILFHGEVLRSEGRSE